MLETLAFLISGIIFGLSAGISPGPLLALVVSETLKFGKKEGIKVAIAPLITDLPIILITIIISAKLSKVNFLLGILSLIGGLFLFYLAYENIKIRKFNFRIKKNETSSLKKGIASNFLNPHPYLFWLFVGAPILFKSYDLTILATVLFVLSFYICLVGSKILIVLAVEKSRNFLRGPIYVHTVRIMGILLLIFAVLFIKDGLTYLDINIFQ